MKKSSIAAILGLVLYGCGTSQAPTAPNTVGSGVLEKHENIEFVGVVLNDRNARIMYDVSHLPADQKVIGAMVQYEGNVDSTMPLPAGVPSKIELTKFQMVGIEN